MLSSLTTFGQKRFTTYYQNYYRKKNRDTTTFQNAYTINLEALIFRDVKITFTHRISNEKYFESMLSYSIPYGEKSRINDNYSLGLYDPFFYYGRAQIRVGLKKYLTHRYYLGLMFSYSYGHFNKGDASYQDDGFHYVVTRNKNDFELFFKTGWTLEHEKLLKDFYLGIGFRYKLLSDEVYEDLYKDSTSPLPHPAYPYHVNHSYGIITFHLGYQIGYCK